MDALQAITEALKFIFPAYCANAIPVIAGGGSPIDFGRLFTDGRPLFGKNKTFRGFFVGLLLGVAVGAVESVVFRYPYAFGLTVSIGALLGDLCGAFIKRRLNIPPGGLLPVVDQIDFVVGAIVLAVILVPDVLSWETAVAALIITPPIHLLTNYTAYRLGLKSNPW